MSKRLRYTALVILAVGLLVPAGLAAQDIVYTGCIRSADGSLYSVRQGTTPMAPCRGKDKQISWNMAGQPGPPGPAGPSLPSWLGIDVNCDEHQSINTALGQQAEKLTIWISGTCVEQVHIGRDDVTLQGVGTNPTITAPAGVESAIQIGGAQRVYLQDLAVTGGTWMTLDARDGAYFTGYQLKISNPTGTGLYIGNGAAAFLEQSQIAGCQGGGAHVDSGSSLLLQHSQVIDNGDLGVFVQGSVLTLWGSNVARNRFGVLVRNGRAVIGRAWDNAACTILDNRDHGVNLGTSHLYLDSCRIAGNGNAGIGLAGGSTAVLDNVIVQANRSNIYAQQGSNIRVGGASTIEGGTERPGIRLYDTCAADVSAESSITGFPYGIECAPPPSVAQLTWPVPDTVSTNCPTGQ